MPIRPFRTFAALGALCLAGTAAATDAGKARVLDGFDDPAAWDVRTSNQVTGALRRVEGRDGPALCLDYDYNGVSGYVGIQREIPLMYPENYAFDFRLKGDSPANDLQFKVIDDSGDNVWWVNRPKYAFPKDWTDVRYRKRHVDKAWGPEPDKTLRASRMVEFTIYNNAGGKGSVCFDRLAFTPLPAEDTSPLAPTARATAGRDASAAVDGDPATAWRAPVGEGAAPALTLDLGKPREFGGLRLQWDPSAFASAYTVALSTDGRRWRDVHAVTRGTGRRDAIALPESEARYVRITPTAGPTGEVALVAATVEPLAFSAHPNDVVKALAQDAPRGWFPRGFRGEQPYWTIVGIDGGIEQGLIGEDGGVEVGKGGFSIEPLLQVDGKLLTWADVQTSQSLQDGYLPIPGVTWTHDAARLRVTALAHGDRTASRMIARYRLENPAATAKTYRLALALQPWQVNPPAQFLNTLGGVSRIEALAFDGKAAVVNGRPRVFARTAPQAAFATPFEAGMATERFAAGDVAGTAFDRDASGMASGAFVYDVTLQPGAHADFDLMIPLAGTTDTTAAWDADALQAEVIETWRRKLDVVGFTVPAAGQPMVDSIRTQLAHMLISRIGPRLQPGTRSYNRSWIRDGAMISEGLLRLGRPEVVKEYVEWYAPYQFKDGMVPCCVDDRGSDPVPENDSHGELIFNIAEYWRFTGDDAFLAAMWPHVRGAFDYMEQLRASERTEANRAVNPAFYGMMPKSISHEGYSAKPMHSYWDNFWALRGYEDAVEIAAALGKADDVSRMTAARDEFRTDLDASLRAAAKLHGIDYLPGSAELGDFDATSTTIALAPGGEQGRLPQDLLENTFERYWTNFTDRRDGRKPWKDYTPYEWRTVAAFVRLGQRQRAWETFEYFFADRAPHAWNQWAEVVSRTPRVPFFVGDLPHAWVGSDYVRSALDMFAYVREVDDSIVLAAGLPPAWFDGEGVSMRGMRTPHGTLGYSLKRTGNTLELTLAPGSGLPAGGVVLPWPYAGTPGRTTINGKTARWTDGELRVQDLPAKVRIEGAR